MKERKCRDTTAEYYPDKLTVDEFADEIKESIDAFVNNMRYLKIEENWAEDWIETLGAWMEMEKD